MKRIIYYTMLLAGIVLSSCTSVEEPQLLQTTGNSISSATRSAEDEGSVLSFENEDAFEAALNMIASFDSDEEKAAWVKSQFPTFKSIQEIYTQALLEANDIDESADSYLSFVDKYSELYFPMEGEDYGFYIPMTNLDAAYLVNASYTVCIGGEMINMRDISSFEQLFELGRTLYNESNPLLASTNYTEFTFSTNIKKIGATYESGWRYNGSKKRKVNLKIDRQLGERDVPPHKIGVSKLHFEISFRKKTIFGYTNYSEDSTLSGTITLANGYSLPINKSQKGMSSHDLWIEVPVIVTPGTNNFIATFPTITGSLKIEMPYFPVENYTINMNGAYCSIPAKGFIVPQF